MTASVFQAFEKNMQEAPLSTELKQIPVLAARVRVPCSA
jgi:hypothetical protein